MGFAKNVNIIYSSVLLFTPATPPMIPAVRHTNSLEKNPPNVTLPNITPPIRHSKNNVTLHSAPCFIPFFRLLLPSTYPAVKHPADRDSKPMIYPKSAGSCSRNSTSEVSSSTAIAANAPTVTAMPKGSIICSFSDLILLMVNSPI